MKTLATTSSAPHFPAALRSRAGAAMLPLALIALAALTMLPVSWPQAAESAASARAAADAVQASGARHAARPRSVQPFTEGWQFTKDDTPGAEQPGFDATGWRAVTLPHDWSIEGPVAESNPSGPAGGFFPGGVGWYRKHFTLPAGDGPNGQRKTFVVFDGVMANSDVWINGTLVGHRPSGYTSFTYDLTPYLKAGDNVIAVRCDNAKEPSLRWYLGGGIYRQVRLVTTDATHIAPWGTFITTPAIAAGSATVHVRSTVQAARAGRLSLAVSLVAPDGSVARAFAGKPVAVRAGASVDLDAEGTLGHPALWDIDHPEMYTARVSLLQDGRAIDNEDVPFGVRSFSFDARQGFFLNGRARKINGVALHVDGGALGAAVPLAVWERRLRALRLLGVNAIRTAHNAAAPELLDLCDRLGLLVMDEFFDQWTLEKVPYDYHLYFNEWATRDVADTVRRDRNHPGIVIYSAGNEIRDTTRPELASTVLKKLLATFHAEDPTRPVTQALFRPNVSHDYDNGYADLLDVVGQNYREKEILAAHQQNPARRIIGTENTHERTQWVALRDHPEYSGQFLWTGVDYLGEAGRWPTVGTGSGLLLTTGLPRPRAWERLSWWTSAPMVKMARRVSNAPGSVVEPVFAAPGAVPATAHAAPATPSAPSRFTQPLLADWTPASTAPHDETVEIYTNADEVELRLNGAPVGTQARHADASPISFRVPYAPGALTATARRDGKVVATDTLRTAGKPARIALAVDGAAGLALGSDWDSVGHVVATLTDADGVRIPDSTTPLTFSVSGAGTLVAVDNGNLTDHTPYSAATRTLYDGQAVAVVRAGAPAGVITVTASAPGLPAATATLRATGSPETVPANQAQRSF